MNAAPNPRPTATARWRTPPRWAATAVAVALISLGVALLEAQRRGGRWNRWSEFETAETPREIGQHSTETPNWTNAPGFGKDVFTFVRIKRSGGGGWGRGGPWHTDAPDSDLNFSYRLQQMTSMRVNPDGCFLHLTDPRLFDYPFIYMVEPGSLYLDDDEAAVLRRYLLNGGFLMLDDFWGDAEWDNMAWELKKVFPDREFEDLPLSHPLYSCVFHITAKSQIPNVELGTRSEFDPEHRTWEENHAGDVRTVHHRVIKDDAGRIMVFAAHNTDNGDGWEWEGDNHYYFETFSEKIAYPLGINVVFYAMTH